MSQLVTARIRSTAAKLGLPHLAESLNQYAERAEEGKLGYLDLLDWCWPRNSPFATTAASAKG
nr:hypothetical protein [Streptomyces kanamyceticus]